MASRGKLLVGLCRETRMPLLKTNVEAADADVVSKSFKCFLEKIE